MKRSPDDSRCPLERKIGEGVPALWFLIAVLWGVVYLLTPFQVDDLQFLGTYRAHNGMSDSFSIAGWWDYIREIRQCDSARVSNVLAIPAMIWAPWNLIFPWLTGMLTATMIWMASRYALGRSLDWRGFGLIWLLIAVFLPWRNFILTVTYSLNYVYPSVLTMFVVWLIMGTDRWNWRFLVGLPLVIVAGWWHEGFAATALCGLGTVMLIRKGRMPLQWWILCLVYGFTVIALVSSPLVVGRMAHESTDPGRWIKLSFAFDALTAIGMVLSILGALTFRAGRRRLGELCAGWKFPLWTVVALSGTCLAFLFTYTPRVCFWPSLAAIIVLGMIWRPIWTRLGPTFRTAVGIVTVLLCTANLLYVIYWQARYDRQYREIMSELDESSTGTVFYDVIPITALPKLTLYYPSKEMWVTQFHFRSLSAARGNLQVAVVPVSLRDATPGNTVRLNGNIPAYTTGDAVFIDAGKVSFLRLDPGLTTFPESIPDCELELADGRRVREPQGLYEYYFNTAGDTLLYFYSQSVPSSEIRGIRLSPENMKVYELPKP